MSHVEHDLVLIACHHGSPTIGEIARIREVLPKYHRQYLVGPIEGQNGYSFIAVLPTGSGSRGGFASDMNVLREQILEVAMADPRSDIVRLRMGGDSPATQVLFTTDDGVLVRNPQEMYWNPTAFARTVRQLANWKANSLLLATKRIDPEDFHLFSKYGSLRRLLLNEPFDWQRHAIDWQSRHSTPPIEVRITAQDIGGIYALEDGSESAYVLGGWDDESRLRSLLLSQIRSASAAAIRSTLEDLWEHAEPFEAGARGDLGLERSTFGWLGWIVSDIAERCDEYGLQGLAEEIRGVPLSDTTHSELLRALEALVVSAQDAGKEDITDDLSRMAGYLGAELDGK